MKEIFNLIIELYLQSPIPLRVAYGIWAGFITIYLYAKQHDKYHSKIKSKTLTQKNFSSVLVVISLLFVAYYHGSILFFPQKSFTVFNVYPDWLFVTGVLIMLYGLWLVSRGRAALNGYWERDIYSYSKTYTKLVDFGVYSKVRHPIYLGQFYLALGTACLSNSYIVFLFPIILAFANYKRAKNEANDLANRFGEDYEEYKKKTEIFLPGLF